MSKDTPTPAALQEAVEGLQRVLDYHDHLIRHKGIMGQMLPCCQSHIDLDLARSALHFLAPPLDPGEAPAPALGDRVGDREVVAKVLLKDYDQQYSNGNLEDFFPLADGILEALKFRMGPSPQGLGEARTPREVDLTAIETRLLNRIELGVGADPEDVSALVAEIRRLRAAAPSPAPAPTT